MLQSGSAGWRAEGSISVSPRGVFSWVSSHGPSSSPCSQRDTLLPTADKGGKGVTSQRPGNKEGCPSGVICREAKGTWSRLRLMRWSAGKGHTQHAP